MTDKELLELAAKAAGYPFEDGHFEEAPKPGAWWGWMYIDIAGTPPTDSAWTELWNPLEDDGDALRLAVKLRLEIRQYLSQAEAFMAGTRDKHKNAAEYGRDNDPYTATRRAIVRAAAEIGRNL